MNHLYDTDLARWSEQQAALLRRRAAGELINDAEFDWPNVAEEIEVLGRSERSALASRIATIIEHLARLVVSPATEPRAGWQETILRARADIEDILKSNPSLRPTLDAVVAHQHALRLVEGVMSLYDETPRIPLEGIRYQTDQVLGPWLPGV